VSVRFLIGDVREKLRELPDESVHCVCTSPPYFGLRSYLPDGHDDKPKEIGAEATPAAYVAELVAVFREVKRVLRSDGVCFINLGDSYCSSSFTMQYSVREDCSLEELQHVALAMFGLRIADNEAPSERPLREMLSTEVQGRAVCKRPDMEGEKLSTELLAPPGSRNRQDGREEPSDQARCDRSSRRGMRLLRGDDTAISNPRSHQRGRRGPSEENGAINDQNLSAGAAGGLPETQISNPLLQLQLRDRIMGLLSARKFTATEIPAAVRTCFKASSRVKPKDLLMIPARVAIALQEDGWYLRQDIIFSKPNPMPESTQDRCTKSHEYIFLLTKSASYAYDAQAIAEPVRR
jgi:hypothetical protein